MTSNKLIFVFSGAGALVGGVAGFLTAYKTLEKEYLDRLDERAKELEDYYCSLEQYDREVDNYLNGQEPESKVKGREDGVLSKDQRNDIRDKLLRNERETTDYARMYVPKKNVESVKGLDIEDLAESEHPEDDESEEEEDPDMERAFEEHRSNIGRQPRIISAEAAGELGPEWDEKALLYYYYYGILTTEDGDIIDDEALLVGDTLDKYGFGKNDDEMIIYVQNFAHDTVYEVQKVLSAFDPRV